MACVPTDQSSSPYWLNATSVFNKTLSLTAEPTILICLLVIIFRESIAMTLFKVLFFLTAQLQELFNSSISRHLERGQSLVNTVVLDSVSQNEENKVSPEYMTVSHGEYEALLKGHIFLLLFAQRSISNIAFALK